MRLGRIGGLGAAIALTAVLAGCGKKSPENLDCTTKPTLSDNMKGIMRAENTMNAEAACLEVSSACNNVLKLKSIKGLSQEALDWMSLGCTNVYNTCVRRMSSELDQAMVRAVDVIR